MQKNMRDVIKRMNGSAAILNSSVTPSHGKSTSSFGASPGNVVGLNENVKTVDKVNNDDMVKESIVDTEGKKTVSVRSKVILYVADSMFHE